MTDFAHPITFQVDPETLVHKLAYSHMFCRTSAPDAYDYEYVIQLAAVDGVRTVAIPRGSYAYQTDRYLSGMHSLIHLSAWELAP